ncbi:MAG: SDR family NAD(P)-dependent oxidoreductase [Chloroflexi bacterium]|nr:SDR family NAD(P)-dependent oxidoreductase [Chloroflexota bacterium]
MMANWTEENIPDQSGRTVIVTGANSGLGLRTSEVLADKGAHVVMAVRSMDKGQAALEGIKEQNPDASLDLMKLDLGNLASVRAFAGAFKDKYEKLDLLYNNAGLMAIPRRETADGFEMQFGVNHLGHFALTGQLLEKMVNLPGSRVVTLSSTAIFVGTIDFDDLHSKRSYSRYGAYGQSKLANLIFAYELQRRLAAAGAETISIAAQPGFAYGQLQQRAAGEGGGSLEGWVYGVLGRTVAQSMEMGTLSQLYAGTAPEAEAGGFYGPERWWVQGYPGPNGDVKAARDQEIATRLWQVSEELTGETYEVLKTIAANA